MISIHNIDLLICIIYLKIFNKASEFIVNFENTRHVELSFFLNGFLMVAGGREKIEQKIAAGFIEPGFEDLQKGRTARLKRAER